MHERMRGAGSAPTALPMCGPNSAGQYQLEHGCDRGRAALKARVLFCRLVADLDLEADPAAHPHIGVHDHRHVRGHLAGDPAIPDVNAPQLHRCNLVEGQRLQGLFAFTRKLLPSGLDFLR